MTRSCLHCALVRALLAEADAFPARAQELMLHRGEPVWLPWPGGRVYRELRRLLADARAVADGGAITPSILDMIGKSHVEVIVKVGTGRHVRVLSRTFGRTAPGSLSGGFLEGLAPDAATESAQRSSRSWRSSFT